MLLYQNKRKIIMQMTKLFLKIKKRKRKYNDFEREHELKKIKILKYKRYFQK